MVAGAAYCALLQLLPNGEVVNQAEFLEAVKAVPQERWLTAFDEFSFLGPCWGASLKHFNYRLRTEGGIIQQTKYSEQHRFYTEIISVVGLGYGPETARARLAISYACHALFGRDHLSKKDFGLLAEAISLVGVEL